MIILHGAGSRKENHADFARAAPAYGFAALTFDNRGHGETEGDLGRERDRRPAAAGALARRSAPEIDGEPDRGAGLQHGRPDGAPPRPRPSPHVAAVVAICPAAEWMMLPRTSSAWPTGKPPPAGSALDEMRIDARSLLAWLDANDVERAVERLGPSR